jgi:Kelch motif
MYSNNHHKGRQGHATVAVEGYVYLLGGFLGATRFNDVWKSSDCGTTFAVISYQTINVEIISTVLGLTLESITEKCVVKLTSRDEMLKGEHLLVECSNRIIFVTSLSSTVVSLLSYTVMSHQLNAIAISLTDLTG